MATEPATLHPDRARYKELLGVLWQLHLKKGEDYGADSEPFQNILRSAQDWSLKEWVSAMQRLGDKVYRLQVHASGKELANEPPSESFLDIASYALIAHIMYERFELSGHQLGEPARKEAADESRDPQPG